MKRTYVDTPVLFAAARGTPELYERAMAVLDDPEREFVSSIFLLLEVLPVPSFNGRATEVDFYRDYFAACTQHVDASRELCDAALQEALRYGMGACDALHVESAVVANAAELITAEGPSTSLHRTQRLPIVTIYRLAAG
jgi:predicted nucleic acid-binding protein